MVVLLVGLVVGGNAVSGMNNWEGVVVAAAVVTSETQCKKLT